ncbi:MAG: type II secretion system protein N [Luminiphilus sp.]|nr:type II secretion system protein N [Luminiphilus sp.]
MSKSYEQISGLKAQVAEFGLRMGLVGLPRQFQKMVIVSVFIWAAFSASALFWAFWPSSKIVAMPAVVVNPPLDATTRSGADEVVLEGMLDLGLFGDAIDMGDINALELMPEAVPDGIEKGARDTQLDLKLVGTLAGSVPDAGTAVIEVKGRQMTFAVGDELPIASRVRLAKVLPTRVVLDNNGAYELLKLFDEPTAFFGPIEQRVPAAAGQQSKLSTPGSAPAKAATTTEQGAQIAADYRKKFYEKPQSVSDLLTIQPVRGADGLQGYRVTPAKNADDFKAIGFAPNDLITGVNGLSLLDASNGARLYGLMRDAQEITFDIERDSVPLTLTVSLQTGAQR